MCDRYRQYLVGVFTAVVCIAGVAQAGAVDDARLRAASNATTDWLTYGHNYDNQRFSTLNQINRNNVKRLVGRTSM